MAVHAKKPIVNPTPADEFRAVAYSHDFRIFPSVGFSMTSLLHTMMFDFQPNAQGISDFTIPTDAEIVTLNSKIRSFLAAADLPARIRQYTPFELSVAATTILNAPGAASQKIILDAILPTRIDYLRLITPRMAYKSMEWAVAYRDALLANGGDDGVPVIHAPLRK